VSVIDIKGLHKSFGDMHVLKGIDLTVEPGEVVVIIGPSGSGKSTLLRCINFLEFPDEGEIRVNGEPIDPKKTNLDKVRQHMGMVFQQFQLFPHKNVLHNITIAPIEVKGLHHKQANAIARDLLEKVGCPTGRRRGPPSSPEGRSSASPSPEPSRWTPTSCCSTRSRPRSTRSSSTRSCR